MSTAPKVFSLSVAIGLLCIGCDPGSRGSGDDSSLETGVQLPGTGGMSDDATASGGGDEPGSADGSGTAGDGPDSDSNGDPDGTSGSGEPGDDGPPPCNDETIQLAVEPPQVVLLLDKSGSMVQNEWDHDDDPVTPSITRWNSLYNVVDTLTHDVEDGMELGMVLFPSASLTETDAATACMVDSDPAASVSLNNADSIVSALPDAQTTEIYGGTPVSGGMSVVLEHLAEVEDGRAQAILLVTDGAANCMDGTSGNDVFTEYDAELAPLVAGAFSEGIPTYVVGVDILDEVGIYPEDNPYVRLNELAQAGGVPQQGGMDSFYNTTDETQLLQALGEITSELGCTIELTVPPEFENQLTVEIGGVEVPRVDQCEADGEGWRYLQDSAPYTSIELCPGSCDSAQTTAALDVEYSCIPQG
ncbi:MAG: hypothetical protein AAGF11_08615 [Myxococcota bacterium]